MNRACTQHIQEKADAGATDRLLSLLSTILARFLCHSEVSYLVMQVLLLTCADEFLAGVLQPANSLNDIGQR